MQDKRRGRLSRRGEKAGEGGVPGDLHEGDLPAERAEVDVQEKKLRAAAQGSEAGEEAEQGEGDGLG